MAKGLIAIHLPARTEGTPTHAYVDEGMGKYGRPELVLALAERGHKAVFLRGPDVYDLQAKTVHILTPKITILNGLYQVQATPTTIAIKVIRAIQNITHSIGTNVPELNLPSVRMLARDKVKTNEVLAPHSLAKVFAGWKQGDSLHDALDSFPGDRVVMKPRKGRKSRHITVTTKQGLIGREAEGAFGSGDWIIEERLDFAPTIDVKGVDDENQRKIDRANTLGLPKELRAFCFGRNEAGHVITSYVMRIGKIDSDTFLVDDEWVYIDETSVPSEVVASTDQVIKAFEDACLAKEVHLAIDWVRVLRHGQDQPVWLPMEVNGSEPQLVRTRQNSVVAGVQTNFLADQLQRMAQTSRA